MILISYILTTFNKYTYLKHTLEYLLDELNELEELIVTDGGSTDSTKELLRFLSQKYASKNFIYISEKDCGEAHGFNKAMFLSKGKYLKVITDDDAFHLSTIRKVSEWMNFQPDIDICGSEGVSVEIKNDKIYFHNNNQEKYWKIYKQKKKPFLLTGLSYLIRKESLSKTGVFNTNNKIIDYEFSLRTLSNPNIKYAFSYAPFYVNIVNPNSNSLRLIRNLIEEYTHWNKCYQSIPSHKIHLWKLKMKMSMFYQHIRRLNNLERDFDFDNHFVDIFYKSISYLDSLNQNDIFIEKIS